MRSTDFTEARDSEWQWHQLGHVQICISFQTDNHASTPPLKSFFTGGCFFCRATNNIEALKANIIRDYMYFYRPSFIRIGKGLWAREPLKHYKLSQNIDVLAGFCPSRATAKTNPDKIWCRCIACTICLLHCAKFG